MLPTIHSMSLEGPDVPAAIFRVMALFLGYGTLLRHNLHPCGYVLVLMAGRSISTIVVHAAFPPSPTWNSAIPRRPRRRESVVSGAWEALSWVLLVVCIGKLHPFRVVVGEQLMWMWSICGNYRLVFPIMISAVVMLAWASNLSTTHDITSAEDAIHGLDSVRGMLSLLLFVASELLRFRYLVGPSPTGNDDRDHHRSSHAEDVAEWRNNATVVGAVAGVSTAALLTVGVGAHGALFATAGDWIGDVAIDVCFFFLLPMAAVVWRGARRRRNTSKRGGSLLTHSLAATSREATSPTVLVAVNATCAFVLHTLYHQHYRSGRTISNEYHPMFHIDNVVVLASASLVCFGYFLGRQSEIPSGFGDNSDSLALFDLTPSKHLSTMQTVRLVLSHQRQRKLFIFFCLTGCFMLVELLYGMHANSLSLVSDAFHMMLDAASIALGLWTSVMAMWSRTEKHPFGYSGYEALSGFANGVVLVLVAAWIFVESIVRLWSPAEMDMEHLLVVAVGGLLVNVVGVVFFHEAHSHHGHSHGDGGCCAAEQNMRGVYLHILADLLGSVAVIASALVIQATGWTVVDAVCSGAISTFIFVSAMPLVRESGLLLLQSNRVPAYRQGNVKDFLAAVEKVDGVAKVLEFAPTAHGGALVLCGLSLLVKPGADCVRIRATCRRLGASLCKDITVELLP